MKTLSDIQANTPKSLSARIACSIPFFVVISLFLIFCVTHVYAGQVTLGWDQNTEPDLAGYKIYYGNSSGNYTQTKDVIGKTATSCTITNLTEGQTYYFAATAYNSSLVESNYSAEVSCAITPATTTIPVPDCVVVMPASGDQGANLEVTITASNTNFSNNVTVASLSGPGITINSTQINSATEAVANITIDPDATLGERDVTATTGGETVTCTAAFTITAAQVTTTTSTVEPTTSSSTASLVPTTTTTIQPTTSSSTTTTIASTSSTSSTSSTPSTSSTTASISSTSSSTITSIAGSSFSDTFDTNGTALGTNWTEDTTGLVYVANNVARSTDCATNYKSFAHYNVKSFGLSQYACFMPTALGQSGSYSYVGASFRFTSTSNPIYIVWYNSKSKVWEWGYYPTSGTTGTYSTIAVSSTTDAPTVGSDYYGVTLDGTGTSTKVRIWKNPGSSYPTSATTWNGNSSPNWTLSNSGTYRVETSGNSYVGIALFQYISGYPVSLDNFYGGDIGTGVSTTSIVPTTTTTTVQPTTSSSTSSVIPTTSVPTTTTTAITCTYLISPPSSSFKYSGGTGSVNVSTQSECAWSATSNASWIKITSQSGGNGATTVAYSVASNGSSRSRTGTMKIAGKTFTVQQTGLRK